MSKNPWSNEAWAHSRVSTCLAELACLFELASLFVFILFFSSFLSIRKRVYTPTATISLSLFALSNLLRLSNRLLGIERDAVFLWSFSILLAFRELIWMQHFQSVAFFFCADIYSVIFPSRDPLNLICIHTSSSYVYVCLSNANEQTQSHQSQSTEARVVAFHFLFILQFRPIHQHYCLLMSSCWLMKRRLLTF